MHSQVAEVNLKLLLISLILIHSHLAYPQKCSLGNNDHSIGFADQSSDFC